MANRDCSRLSCKFAEIYFLVTVRYHWIVCKLFDNLLDTRRLFFASFYAGFRLWKNYKSIFLTIGDDKFFKGRVSIALEYTKYVNCDALII